MEFIQFEQCYSRDQLLSNNYTYILIRFYTLFTILPKYWNKIRIENNTKIVSEALQTFITNNINISTSITHQRAV